MWNASAWPRPKNVERAVQTDPISTLLRYASAITEQKKCWGLLATFDRFRTLHNRDFKIQRRDGDKNVA